MEGVTVTTFTDEDSSWVTMLLVQISLEIGIVIEGPEEENKERALKVCARDSFIL